MKNTFLKDILVLFTFKVRTHEGARGSDMLPLTLFTPKSGLIDFTLSNARRFYSSKGDPLGVKGLTALCTVDIRGHAEGKFCNGKLK